MLISNFSGGTAILFMMFTFCVLYFSSAQITSSSSSTTTTTTTTTTTSQSFWTTGAPMPTARSEIAGTILDGKIYIIGGFDRSGRSTTATEVYDPMANEWTTAAPLPQPLDHTAAASFEGKLYVVGGGYLTIDNLLNKLFIYDPSTNKCTEVANLPIARCALTSNFIN